MKYLNEIREQEKNIPPYMYACYRIGHMVNDKGLCHCCLQIIPPTGGDKKA